MKIIVKEGQSIWDVAIQYTGSIEGAFAILLANGKKSEEINTGDELVIPSIIDRNVVDYFKSRNVSPSGLIDSDLIISSLCAPAVVNIKKSDGTLIEELTVPSGANLPYNVPDSQIKVNGATYTNLKATETLNVPIIDTNGNSVNTSVVGSNVVVEKQWPRPDDWPDRPDGWEDMPGVHLLVENYGYGPNVNLLSLECNNDVDIYVNGIYDGTLPANTRDVLYEFYPNDYTSIEKGKRKWIWVYLEIPNGSWVSYYNNIYQKTLFKSGLPNTSNMRKLRCYEELVNLDNLILYENLDPGALYRVVKHTKNIVFKKNIYIQYLRRILGGLPILNVENFPKYFSEFEVQAFRGTYLTDDVINIDINNQTTTLGLGTWYQSGANRSLKLINTSSLVNIQNGLSQARFDRVYIEDASNLIDFTNYILYRNLEEVIFNGLNANIRIYGDSMSPEGLLNSLESFADLTGLPSKTLVIRLNQNTLIPTQDVINLAASKNWTLVFV